MNIHKPNGSIDANIAIKQPSFTCSTSVFVSFACINKSYYWEASIERSLFIKLEPKLNQYHLWMIQNETQQIDWEFSSMQTGFLLIGIHSRQGWTLNSYCEA